MASRVAGWTIIELLIALSVMLLVIGLTVNTVNFGDRKSRDIATTLMNAFVATEVASNNYLLEKGDRPTGLSDSTFVPTYLFTPKQPDGFNAYTLANTSSNYYVCATTTAVVVANEFAYKALEEVRNRVSTDKYFVNPTCGATTNLAPTGSTTMSGTYWLTR